MSKRKPILDSQAMNRLLRRMAHDIQARNPDSRSVVLVGVQRGGVLLAERLAQLLQQLWGHPVPVGNLDVGMHRDDLHQQAAPTIHPTVLPFDLEDKNVVLVDDVLFSGRTTRAALDALNDFGRPRRIQLAVLIDRGHRELPIKADYVGQNIDAEPEERVDVHLKEESGEDVVYLERD